MLHKAVMKSGGLSEEEAYDNFFIMDNNGLITNERELEFPREAAVEPFAKARKATKELPDGASLLDVVTKSKCTALLGASTVNGLFTEDVLRQMGEQNERPIIPAIQRQTRVYFEYGESDDEGDFLERVRLKTKSVSDGDAQTREQFVHFPGLGLGAVLMVQRRFPRKCVFGQQSRMSRRNSKRMFSR